MLNIRITRFSGQKKTNQPQPLEKIIVTSNNKNVLAMASFKYVSWR